jgi:hypothetical protein
MVWSVIGRSRGSCRELNFQGAKTKSSLSFLLYHPKAEAAELVVINERRSWPGGKTLTPAEVKATQRAIPEKAAAVIAALLTRPIGLPVDSLNGFRPIAYAQWRNLSFAVRIAVLMRFC